MNAHLAAPGLFRECGHPTIIEASVRAELAESLAHIVDRAQSYLNVDHGSVAAAIERIRGARQEPGVFARYFDLIFSVSANDFAKADILLAEIVERISSEPASLNIVPYARKDLGSDYDRFPRLVFAEFSENNPMASPSPAQSSGAAQALTQAREIISIVDPRIHDETEAFLTRIYLAAPSWHPGAKRFGGVTSLMAWGSSFINVDFYRTRWDAVQFLVHEITHSLLLGLSCREPLVRNPPEESYKSPLRAEPRPMDGIFHATLVCARLASFNRSWLESGLLAEDAFLASEKAVDSNLRGFRDGLDVVEKFGDLSQGGRDLLASARDELSALA